MEDNEEIIEFNFDFSQGIINFADLTITTSTNESNFGFITIQGIDLTSQNKTKTVYLNRILNSSGICIKDTETATVQEITSSCKGANEIWVKCPGTNGQYICELIENNTRYKVSGLKHSGVKEQETYCGDGVCESGETCSYCSADCGSCPDTTSSSSTGGSSGFERRNTTNATTTVQQPVMPDLTALMANFASKQAKTISKGELKGKIDISLGLGDKVSFEIKEESHSFQVTELKQDMISFELNSKTIKDTLKISQIKKYDLNDNKIDDLKIYLKEITDGKANLEIEKITEPSNDKITGAAVGTIGEGSWIYFAAFIIGLAILFVLAFALKKRKIKQSK